MGPGVRRDDARIGWRTGINFDPEAGQPISVAGIWSAIKSRGEIGWRSSRCFSS